MEEQTVVQINATKRDRASTLSSKRTRALHSAKATLQKAKAQGCLWFIGISSCFTPFAALSYDGILASDLPSGGDVTVPGQYPIQIPPTIEVLLSGMDAPQSVTLSNKGESPSIVHIYAQHEKTKRILNIKPGMSAVYTLKRGRPIRIRVESGKVDALSLAPIKIQR